MKNPLADAGDVVQSVIGEGPTCHGAAKPWAPTIEPALQTPGARRDAAAMRSPCTATGETPTQPGRPSTAKNKYNSFF